MTSSSTAAGIISAINGEVLQEVVERSIAQLGNIKYKNYVRITFSNTSSGILKNAGRACNNAIYTSLGHADMKIVGNCVVNAAAFLVDIGADYTTYGANSKDLVKALVVTTAAAAACIAICATLPETAMGVAFGIAWGVVIGWESSEIKKNWIGY